MKILFILIIKLYWKIFPEEKRNSCIFSESCSKYVKRTIEKDGLINGLKAFFFRFKHCRHGYSLQKNNDTIILLSLNKIKIPEKEINPQIIKIYKSIIKINNY